MINTNKNDVYNAFDELFKESVNKKEYVSSIENKKLNITSTNQFYYQNFHLLDIYKYYE